MRQLLPKEISTSPRAFGPVPFRTFFLSYHCEAKSLSAQQPMSRQAPVMKMSALPLPSKGETVDDAAFQWPIALIEAQVLESRTVGQTTNQEWLELHKSTLTASNFWRICHSNCGAANLPSSIFDGGVGQCAGHSAWQEKWENSRPGLH